MPTLAEIDAVIARQAARVRKTGCIRRGEGPWRIRVSRRWRYSVADIWPVEA